MNYDQEHTTCIKWNKTFFKSNLCTLKKRVVTLEFVVPSCWPPTLTKLLFMFDKMHSPSNQQSYLPSHFLFLFFYSPLPTTLTTTTFLSSLWPILFFPTSFVPTQEGKPSTSLLNQTLSFYIHPPFSIATLLGLTPILSTFSSICPWMEQFPKTSLEQPPPLTSDTSTSISIRLVGRVHLESSPLHDAIASSQYFVSSQYIEPP